MNLSTQKAYWRLMVGKEVYGDPLTTEEAARRMQHLAPCVLNLSLERLSALEELTA